MKNLIYTLWALLFLVLCHSAIAQDQQGNSGGILSGNLEANAANWIKANGTKPVVGFIAGETAPAGRTMGHAGAIVGGEEDTAQAKKKIMRACGITVVDSPADIGEAMAELMKVTA